ATANPKSQCRNPKGRQKTSLVSDFGFRISDFNLSWSQERTTMPAPLLEVRDLEKSYGTVRALQKVTFQVHEGERFGLLGPNGAGKTTLLSIVSGLLSPGGGEVRLQGRSLFDGGRDWKRLLGIVPQDLAVYSEL